jgi:hypothetical protein
MGCKNGKHVLTEEDFDFIANHTAISRDDVEKVRYYIKYSKNNTFLSIDFR